MLPEAGAATPDGRQENRQENRRGANRPTAILRARCPRQAPISASQSSSLSTLSPSSRAFFSFDPAPGPTTT